MKEQVNIKGYITLKNGFPIITSNKRQLTQSQSLRNNKTGKIIRAEAKRINADIINAHNCAKYERNAIDLYFEQKRRERAETQRAKYKAKRAK